MTISIPSIVFDTYNKIVDYLLDNDNFSRVCTIYYPPIKEPCTNCPKLAGTSTNVWQGGEPAPFSFNSCQYCGGKGFREKEVTETIRLRIYWQKRDWVKIGNIAVPNATCQVIGYTTDLPKLMTCKFINLISEEHAVEKDYKLAAKPFLHGFGKSRYFIAYLEDA
jgi:hypothetical protein